MRHLAPLLALCILVVGLAVAPRHMASRSAISPDFVHFESGHVHPAALTPDGKRLLVVNTPNDRLAVFDVTGPQPVLLYDMPVGLEPVSVAARSDGEAWVVNNVSDDVSIVDLVTRHVRATLRVGDEPADVVFANGRAYVSVSQYDQVRVYDPGTLALVASIPIDSRMPRSLARSADGSRVYVAGFQAGNRTSVLSEAEVGDALPPPHPPMDPSLPPAPQVALIIQQQANGNWVDETGKRWNEKAPYTVLDADVSEISTVSNTVLRTFGGIGTLNFALAVNGAGTVAATATEARNLVRFQPNLSGHLVDTRAAFITGAGTVSVRNLDPHVDYSVTPGPPGEADSSIGIPTGAAWSGDGQQLYVTSLASDMVAVLDATGRIRARVAAVAGPTGVVVDDVRGRLYVVGRFHNQLQTLSTADFSELGLASIGFDPTPDEIVNGRKFFFGGFTSGHGDQACATCHPFGDFDNIGWDLGDPRGPMQRIDTRGQFNDGIVSAAHPMKGPMITQTLRGLPPTGMLHWRADRLNLDAFNQAFVGLLGHPGTLPDSEMAAFDEFVLPLVHPPNPNERLNRTMPGDPGPSNTPSALRGQTFFFDRPVCFFPFSSCASCHFAGLFLPGTNGQIVNHFFARGSQDIKVPQLRNLYRKTGFSDRPGAVSKRGFGFTHNGSVDNLIDFFLFMGFNFGGPPVEDGNRRDVEQFLLCFDTGMAPAVGFQMTFDGRNNAAPGVIACLDTLIEQADLGNCDLVAKGKVNGQPRGWLYAGVGMWRPDKVWEGDITTSSLRARGAPGSELTVTGAPPGTGLRLGIDQDRDGYRDGDELDAGSDPSNPLSMPASNPLATHDVRLRSRDRGPLGRHDTAPGRMEEQGREEFALRTIGPNPFPADLEVAFTLGRAGPVDLVVYDVFGREVREVARRLRLEAGTQSLRWDGRDRDGREAGAGLYFVRLRTESATWTRPVTRVH
jgi:YVTN family beta-propeller protein